jgi:hypothetical protein
VLSPYLLAFAIVFFAVVCVPSYKLIVRFARKFAELEQAAGTPEKAP